MAKVTMLRRDDGSAAFQWGSAGTPYEFVPGDDDSTAIAFTKAVNDGIEAGDKIEGAAAIRVAEVLKAETGTVQWDSEDGYNDLRSDLQCALPKLGDNIYAYVDDVSVNGNLCLVCVSGNQLDGGSYGSTYFVVGYTMSGDDCVLDPRANWVEVESDTRYVAKGNDHRDAARSAYDALGKLLKADSGGAVEHDPVKDTGPALGYTVEKADSAMRYTLGPLYAPNREDAHGEWVEDDTLHKSLHEFVRDSAESGRRINLQHGDKGDVQCGEWVECVRWPYEHTIKMTNAAGEVHDVEMPAGTVYLGVVWDEDYWDVAKSAPKGIDGYSLGGRAMKVKGTDEALKSMGYKVSKASTEPHEYDGGKDGSGPCTSCGMSKSAGNHMTSSSKAAEQDLAIEVGRTAGERTAYKDLTERLLGVLNKHAEGGVTINENTNIPLDKLLSE